MVKLRYTREQMEAIIMCQLENLEAIGEQTRLLKKHNELLEKKVRKLKEQLSEKKKPKPYVTMVAPKVQISNDLTDTDYWWAVYEEWKRLYDLKDLTEQVDAKRNS